MLGRLTGAVLALALCGDAYAAKPKVEWTPVSAAGSATYFVSALAAVRDGDIVSSAYRVDYKKPRKAPAGAAYETVTNRVKVDCAQNRIQRQSAIYAAAGGQVVQEQGKGRWRPISPSSPEVAVAEALCGPQASKPAPPKRATAKAEAPTFGTAWASDKGYLVTASHVIAGGRTIELFQGGKKVGEARVVADDKTNDVAVLKYVPKAGIKLKMIPLAEKPGALGRSVFTLGFPEPDVMGQAVKLSKGDIAAMSGVQDDARFLQISIPIQQGNSGGPVVGFDGSALGVVSSKLTRFSGEKDALKPENVNYAVKVSYLKPLLAALPDLADYTPIQAAGASQEELIAQVSQAVYMVVVSP